MARKKYQKIPKHVMLRCPQCSGRSKAIVSVDICPQQFTCPKCEANVRTPLTQCCVICAFSTTSCPRTLYMQAKIKGLELR